MNRGVVGVLLVVLGLPLWLCAQAGVAPKVLFDPAAVNAGKQVEIANTSGQQVSSSLGQDGLNVHIKGGGGFLSGGGDQA